MMKPKGMVVDIVADLKKERGKSDPEESGESAPDDEAAEGESDMGLNACGDDLLSAIKNEDSAGIVSALRSFLDMYEKPAPTDEE